MKYSAVHAFCLSLPGVTEEPHHHFGSFRVRGRIFVTVHPDREHIHVFIPERLREQTVGMYPEYTEKLLWCGKVVGVRVHLPRAVAGVVKSLLREAWAAKAPKGVATGSSRPTAR